MILGNGPDYLIGPRPRDAGSELKLSAQACGNGSALKISATMAPAGHPADGTSTNRSRSPSRACGDFSDGRAIANKPSKSSWRTKTTRTGRALNVPSLTTRRRLGPGDLSPKPISAVGGRGINPLARWSRPLHQVAGRGPATTGARAKRRFRPALAAANLAACLGGDGPVSGRS